MESFRAFGSISAPFAAQNPTVSRLRKDIAPGQPHIACRSKGITYYVPSLFHLAPSYGKVIPLTIQDVMRSKSALEIYGVQGLESHKNGLILVNNYPVKEAKIMGRVLSCKTVYVNNNGGPSDKDFVILQMDDFSGDHSCISVKLLACLNPSMANLQPGVLVEVIGSVVYVQNYGKQMLAAQAVVVGGGKDFDVELQWWATILKVRRFLSKPWVYTPSEITAPYGAIPQFSRNTLRAQKRKVCVIEPINDSLDEPTAVQSGLPFARDSVLEPWRGPSEAIYVSDSGSETIPAGSRPQNAIDLTRDET